MSELPDMVVRYADHADGLIDVFLPPSLGRPAAPAPLVVFVHGGFWRQEWDRKHVRPLANDLIQRGYVVAVPEYRRTGGLGGWPETGYDVEAALAAVPGLIEGVAPGHVDTDQPATVAGHSAGGHLALWAGLRAGTGAVSHVVALAPVSDLRDAARRNLDGGAAQDLLGGGPDDVPAAYAEADPLAVLSPAGPPVTVIHGSADLQVPVEMSRVLAKAHPYTDYVELDGVDHFALIDPTSHAYASTVTVALRPG